MGMPICVYSASSNSADSTYYQAARELGALMASRGDSLVFGGGCTGLMGEVARSVHAGGGHVIGVIPAYMRKEGTCYEESDELIVTKDIRERKAVMESLADAFIALPGGFGTLEEVMEIVTLKQLHIHQKAIVFLDTNRFYDPLQELFEHVYRERFSRPEHRALYHFAPDPAAALDYISSYVQPGPADGS